MLMLASAMIFDIVADSKSLGHTSFELFEDNGSKDSKKLLCSKYQRVIIPPLTKLFQDSYSRMTTSHVVI